MCGLCGTLGDGAHWADGVVRPGESAASAVPWLRRQARRRRVALGNAVLRHYGLSLADWQGSAFLLRSRTGAAGTVQGLADLWREAERWRAGRSTRSTRRCSTGWNAMAPGDAHRSEGRRVAGP